MDRLTAMLRAVRGIGRLITHETDRDHLLSGACRLLAEPLGFHNVWIALLKDPASSTEEVLNGGRPVASVYHAGDVDLTSVTERLRAGELPVCARRTFGSESVHSVQNPWSECSACPLMPGHAGRAGLSVSLEHEGRVFGWMNASVPQARFADEEQECLFAEVAQDLAHAVWSIETEARRESIEREFDVRRVEHAQLLKAAVDGVWVVDTEGRLLEVNPAAARMLGYTQEEMTVLTVNDIDVLETPDDTEHHVLEVREKGTGRFETWHRRKDGSFLDVEVSVSLVPGSGHYVAFVRDVTERKKVEFEQEITLQLLSLLSSPNGLHDFLAEVARLMQEWSGCEAVGIRLLEGESYPYVETRGFQPRPALGKDELCAGDGCAEKDGGPTCACVCGNVLRGRFEASLPFFTESGTFWTNSTTELSAPPDGTLRESRARIRCHGEGHESVALIPLRQGTETLGLLQLSDRRRDRFDANHIALFERLAANLALGLAQRRSAQALRESEANLSALIESTGDVIVSRDREGRAVVFNRGFVRTVETLFGQVARPGIRTTDFLPEAAKAHWEAVLEVVLSGGNHREEFTWETGGEIRHYEISVNPIEAGGQIIGSAEFTRDVTEQKRAEAERDHLEQQLHQAQKMESVGRLAGGVAHDFNNMLAVIIGHAEMGLTKLGPEHPVHESLQEIRHSAERSAELTRQLLAFARKQTVSPRILSLNDSVEGMLKILRRLIGENIELVWKPGEGLWPVKIDPGQVDQLLANLCVNARDAIDGSGEIVIETGNVRVEEDTCAGNLALLFGEYVLLTVRDTGCGMDAQTRVHLFEPFFTTKRPGEGTGLGLSTVYGIVKQNEGVIDFDSEPGHGTTFRIYLPRHEGKDEQPGSGASPGSDVRGHETVLLVEDERAILALGKRMLERLGYRVLAAGTPSEAIDLAEKHPEDIHLLLTDVIMPEMNGHDLSAKLQSLYPDMKRIFVSGYTADVIAHQGVLEKGVHFLQKPFSMKKLAGELRRALG